MEFLELLLRRIFAISFVVGFLGGVYFLFRYLRYLKSAQQSSNPVTGINQNPAFVQNSNPSQPVSLFTKPQGIYFYLFFLVQLIGLLGLFGLLVYNYVSQPQSLRQAGTNQVIKKSSPSPTIKTITETFDPAITARPELRAISPDVEGKFLRGLSRYYADILTKSVLSNIYRGKIKSIDYLEGAKDTQVLVTMVINAPSGVENKMYFIARDIDSAKIITNANGQEMPIDIKDLKIGDNVEITSNVELTGKFPENRISLQISKIE